MSNGINFYSNSQGFDTRLFFPSTLLTSLDGGWVDGFDTNEQKYTIGYVEFHYDDLLYRITYTGSYFDGTLGDDIQGFVKTGKVEVFKHGAFTTVGTMVIFPDAVNNPNNAIAINSAGELTPNSLITNQGKFGGAHLNFLGGPGNDKLFGSDTGDYFNGEGGHDKLTGYGGNDQFLFDAIGTANFDHITDFSHGHDKILLDHSDDGLFAGVTSGNLKKRFHDITSHAEDGNDRILYNHHTGKLFYDEDGKGGEAPVIFAVLDNHAKLGIHDFEIV